MSIEDLARQFASHVRICVVETMGRTEWFLPKECTIREIYFDPKNPQVEVKRGGYNYLLSLKGGSWEAVPFRKDAPNFWNEW